MTNFFFKPKNYELFFNHPNKLKINNITSKNKSK